MHRLGCTSWTITWDFPEELEFGAYLARQEGFDIEDARAPRTEAEAQWRIWWDALPRHTVAARSEQLAREQPELTLDAVLEIVCRMAGFDPPDFARLARLPALQALCRARWPAFQCVWRRAGGEQDALADALNLQLCRLRLARVVTQACAAAGKRRPEPFALRMDVVLWPEEYRRCVTESHIVLGRRYLAHEHCDDLRALVQERVALLV